MLPVPAPRSISRGRARQPIRKPPRQRDAARGMIERFAQREPVGGEPLRHPASACGEFPHLRRPTRQRLPDLPRASAIVATQRRAEDQPPQRLRQVDVIAHRAHHAGLPASPACPPHHRQSPPPARRASTPRRSPCRSLPSASPARTDRPRATALRARRRVTSPAKRTRRAMPSSSASADKRARMHRIAFRRTDDGELPVEIEQPRQRAQQHVMPLARHQRADREDVAGRSAGARCCAAHRRCRAPRP